MLNIAYPIYNPSEVVLKRHINTWKNYSDETRSKIKIILVDDCSDIPVKLDINFPLNLVLARIKTDLGWNINGAKNLCMTLADNDWIFSSDIDHLFTTEDELKKCINLNKKRGYVYGFYRLNEEGKFRGSNHCNTFLFHKEDFWNIGGYDEDMTGRYGYSDCLMTYLINKYYKKIETDITITEFKDATVMTERRKNKELFNKDLKCNEEIALRKIKEIDTGIYKNDTILRFAWEIV